jgi:hypothetical protein
MNAREQTKLKELETRLAHVEKATGVTPPWLTPSEAARILPIGRDRIIQEIQTAERKRAARQNPDLIYGKHYFNTSDTGDRHSWKVHSTDFWAVVQKPAEERS